MIQIPFQQYPAFTQEIDFDGVPFVLDFYYNATGDFWSMNVLSTIYEVIMADIVLQMGADLFAQYHYADIPRGELYVVDPNGDDSPVSRDDFVNGRLQIIYISEGEL